MPTHHHAQGNRSRESPPADFDDERYPEWKALWRRAKGLVWDLFGLLETCGHLVLDLLDLGKDLVAYFAERLRLSLALLAAIGATSPATGGWGIDFLARTSWAAWLPAVGLPAALGLLALVVASLRHLDREADRRLRREQAERPDPQTERELEIERERRRAVAEDLGKNPPAVPLEERDFVSTDLANLYFKINSAPYSNDLKLVLAKWSGSRLLPVAKRGEVPAPLREQLELAWDDVTGIREALDKALQPYQYRHEPVSFSAGENCQDCHFVLVGLSGATIPAHIRLEISRTATTLLSHHAYGENPPQWIAAEAR